MNFLGCDDIFSLSTPVSDDFFEPWLKVYVEEMGHKARRAQTEKRETEGYREFPERMESVSTEYPDQKGNRALSGTTDQGDSKEKSDHLDQPDQKAMMDRPGQWDLRDLQGKKVSCHFGLKKFYGFLRPIEFFVQTFFV